MTENIQDLEFKFGFEEYINNESMEGYIFNFQYCTNTDEESYAKVYFVDKNTNNYFVKLPYYHTLLIESEKLSEVEEYIKHIYTYGFHKSEIIEKYDCSESNYLNKKKNKYLKVYIKYQTVFNKLIKDLKKIVIQNKNNENIEIYKNMVDRKDENEYKSLIRNIHEYDIPTEINIANEYNIRAGCWYNFIYDGENYTITKSSRITIPEFRIFAYDIETTKKPLNFPDAEYDQVMMISIKTESSNILITNREIISEDIGSFDFEPKENMKSRFTVLNMCNEEYLLMKFIEIIQIHKPHIVTTFNGYQFDFPFVEKRMMKYNLILEDLTGFSLTDKYYACPFILHLDCYKWVARDSYLPMGSQGLKAVTKAKLGYFPDEIDPEEMVEYAKTNPYVLASYSVSDAVATYFLFIKYVQPHIFSLSSILPYSPVNILNKGSGTLCEALLIVEANNYSLLIPKENNSNLYELYNDHLIENMTYVGGYVESLKSGIFRSDFLHKFNIKEKDIEELIIDIQEILNAYKDEEDYQVIYEKTITDLKSLINTNTSEGNVYHLDVGAMYPNIILTNRLQPNAIVNNDICVRCDYSAGDNKCKRNLEWEAKIDYFVPKINEIEDLKANLISDYNSKYHKNQMLKEEQRNENNYKKLKQKYSEYETLFENLNISTQEAMIKKKICEYSRQIYKKIRSSVVEKRNAIVCQRSIPFYVDSVRKFRDQRYVYKKLYKEAALKYNNSINPQEKKDIEKEMIVFSSLQVAHKCILNSFYGYVMRKGARWHSTEMAAIVCNIGANIIKECKAVIEKISIPLELDTDGIWILIPRMFPVELSFQSGKKLNLLNSYINYKVCRKFANPQYQTKTDNGYVISTENSIEFEIDGPYKGMIIPSALEEGKQLKKRYLVLNWDNSIAEMKGFELKRRGELEIIKRLQEELFNEFATGSSLKECYDNLANICKYWHKIITTKGKMLDDDTILEYFSECKLMSKNIDEYENKSSNLLNTAMRMSEILGKDILNEKLKVEFVISRYPLNEPVSNRTIPTIIFKSTERDFYIKKWCKIDKVMDIRDIIDWEYYKKRVEDIIIKIICLPALQQNIKNPLPEIRLPDWSYKLSTQYATLDWVKKPKDPIVEIKESIPQINETINNNIYIEYYRNLKTMYGVLMAQINGETLFLKYYPNKFTELRAQKMIYVLAKKKAYINKDAKIVKHILPNSLEAVPLIVVNSLNAVNTSDILEVFHRNIPLLYQYYYGKPKISKYPNFTILTSFKYDKYIIYAFTKKEKTVFISDYKHKEITENDIKAYLLRNNGNLTILNEMDKNFNLLRDLLKDKYLSVQIRVSKTLSSFSELLQIQRSLNQEIMSVVNNRMILSDYTNIPLGNIDDNILDYMYYKEVLDNNGICSDNGPEDIMIYNTEMFSPGLYPFFSIQFECVGSYILSILNYESILHESKEYFGVNRSEFINLYNLVKRIVSDHTNNLEGANLLINKLEKWLSHKSNIFSTELRNVIKLLHQKYIFDLFAELKKHDLEVIYVYSNIFCICTRKTTREGCDDIIKYIQDKMSKHDIYVFQKIRVLRIFEKLVLITPSKYLYMKHNEYFGVCDLEIPLEFIRLYFSEEKISNEDIYRIVTSVEISEARLILQLLEYKKMSSDIISNCKRLLKINEYAKEEEEFKMVIRCDKCSLENILRDKCVKCLHEYSKEAINDIVRKYFDYYLYLEMCDDVYCEKCEKINELKLKMTCVCGGTFKKKSYKTQIQRIISLCTNQNIMDELISDMKYYNIQ